MCCQTTIFAFFEKCKNSPVGLGHGNRTPFDLLYMTPEKAAFEPERVRFEHLSRRGPRAVLLVSPHRLRNDRVSFTKIILGDEYVHTQDEKPYPRCEGHNNHHKLAQEVPEPPCL